MTGNYRRVKKERSKKTSTTRR